VAASQLAAIGMDELVTGSLADYEALALALARDPTRLHAVRDKLAHNRNLMPLFDIARLVQNVQSAYATMHTSKAKGEAPRSFRVGDE
jgi:predicted O-linked N-acetylglucosamine transferase (SPINDLY family)